MTKGADDGKHPTPRSIVTAHYSGWTINGKKFDSSRGGAPIAFRLSDLIEGWIIAMQQMCVGDKWEVYIPSEMGYGKFRLKRQKVPASVLRRKSVGTDSDEQ